MNEFFNKNSSFKIRLKNDKPILKKNSDDFDDSDFNPSFSSEDSNNNDSEVENGLLRKKN
jgi:hypothetical protein